MATVGRNAPCPCGSGRKHKQCCLLEEERLAKQACDDSRVGQLISGWSVEQFGDELARAFEEFHPESHRIGERDFALLLTWFNSDRALSGGGTPIACYLARPDLDPDEREVGERIAVARLGLHRVKAVVPGRSLELEDVLTGALISVASQTVSREVVLWDVVLCRVMPGDPAATLWGPVLVYAPDEEAEFLAELARLAEAHGVSRDPAGLSEVFRLASRELLRFVPPSRLAEPSYFTAEGDPVVSARATWSLLDSDDAFMVLDAPPELLWVGESEDGTGECFQLTGDRKELLARRPPLPPSALFFESSYEGFPDRIGTGTFVLAGCELRFDAISEQRLEHALELVSCRLAGNAELLDREVAPFDLDRPERRGALGPAEEDVLAAGYLEQYLRRWLDEPLQRLEGVTPRAAASIPKLRADLELLLRAIENRAEHARRAGAAWPDVAWLWDELDLTTQLAA
jgi:hypothetical protein